MIKKLSVASIQIQSGIITAGVKIIHDDKNTSGITVALELEGDEKLNAMTEGLIHQIKESMKVKLGIAPTFSE